MYHKSYGAVGKVTGSQIEKDSPELYACLLLDNMAERYGLLPSEVLARGSTQDIYVYDVALSYQEMVRNKLKKQHGIKSDPSVHYDSSTLEQKLKEFKEKKL